MASVNSAIRAINRAAKRGVSTMPATYNEVAVKGFGQGTNEHYDKARPTYPSLVLNHIHSSLRTLKSNPTKPLNILELGSGTGLFTRLMVSPPPLSATIPSSPEGVKPTEATPYPHWNISTLFSVEPSQGMREQWNKSVGPLVEARAKSLGSAEIATVPGGFADLSEVKKRKGQDWRADLIVVAQAWHWCHPDYGAAIAEIESMLAPDGMIALVWNFERLDRKWTRSVKAIEQSLWEGSPQYIRELWQATFDTEEYRRAFEKEQRTKFWWDLVVNDEYIINRSFSKSYIAMRPQGEKDGIRTKLQAILADPESAKEIVDEQAGTFVYPFYTDVIVMQKRSTEW